MHTHTIKRFTERHTAHTAIALYHVLFRQPQATTGMSTSEDEKPTVFAVLK